MNSRLDSLWYAIQHPLGPSRELGSYANHQESVRTHPRDEGKSPSRLTRCGNRLPVPVASTRVVYESDLIDEVRRVVAG